MIFQRVKKIAVGLAVLMLLASCGGGSKITADESKRMQELGEEFVTQIIDELLPIRESLSGQKAQNAVLSTETKTYNIDVFYDFYENYRVGNNAELLTIFSTKSFVVSKIVFEGESGYYFRYEYDIHNPESVVVTPQLLDRVEVAEDDKLNKIELTLIKEKKTNIVFTYKNIERDE